MNIALTKMDESGLPEFYLAGVKKSGMSYIAVSKRVTENGKLVGSSPGFYSYSEHEANVKVRDLIKTKMKKQDWKPIDLEHLPMAVVKFLEVPPGQQVTPEELVMILRETEKERYVTFKDVSGIEEYFDAGVQYLGYEYGEEWMVKVFDKTGKLRECFRRRMEHLELTENAIEATRISSRMKPKDEK